MAKKSNCVYGNKLGQKVGGLFILILFHMYLFIVFLKQMFILAVMLLHLDLSIV